MAGPDHRASLEPAALADMVRAVRAVEAAMGDGVKRPTSTELQNRLVARKSLVAARDIPQGATIVAADLTAKRPGLGMSPMRWDDVVGSRARRDYAEGDPI
jgi:sialic acid synthase SpsE